MVEFLELLSVALSMVFFTNAYHHIKYSIVSEKASAAGLKVNFYLGLLFAIIALALYL